MGQKAGGITPVPPAPRRAPARRSARGGAIPAGPAGDPLERLLEGNRRFVAGTSRNSPGGAAWTSALAAGQRPFATILGCSDSRVPVELVFDQGFGDLFVVRVAGNVVTTHVRGSIEFAVRYLGTSLVVVLGHEGCGAVTAALRPVAERRRESPGIRGLLSLIAPSLRDLDPGLSPEERLRLGVEANVLRSLRQIRMSDPPRVAAAVYELETGRVRLLG